MADQSLENTPTVQVIRHTDVLDALMDFINRDGGTNKLECRILSHQSILLTKNSWDTLILSLDKAESLSLDKAE